MTWQLGALLRTILGVVLIVGCGSSSSKRAKIELLSPDDKVELTTEDDIDPDLPGVQYEVRAKTQNIRPNTVMLLVIAGENTTNFANIGDDGVVVFENATLPPGPHNFHITTATGSVSSAEYSYTLKTLVIETPRDGADIAFGDDTNQDREGVQINVTVRAYAIDGGEDIELEVDGEVIGDPVSPSASGTAVFTDVTLSNGTHTLMAVAGNVKSGTTEVGVNSACASVSYVTPRHDVDQERVTLAGGDECPAAGADYTIDVEISTDAGDGRDVELTVNNTTKARTTVRGALARFEDVVLNRRMSANELSVTVQGAQGVTCAPVPFPKPIFVDCDGSDCTIGSPVPYSGDDAFYLNASLRDDGGFDIRVDSDTGVLGRDLELIIDGRDGRNALREEAAPDANRVSATFSNVALEPGSHTIEARCIDGSGNVTESGQVTWVVDVDACGVTIDAPAAETRFVPEDDRDANADNGLQVEVSATVEGSDCVEARAGVCDPETGIQSGDFTELSGSATTSEITLGTSAQQDLCVEVRDRANNLGLGNVSVGYRSELPNVQIESPVHLTSFNAQGTDGRVADSEPATPVCNADFSVLCTEIGTEVQLHHTDENGPVFASGECEAPAEGDPALPEGFSGRAKLNDVVFLPPAQATATVIATQVITSAGNHMLAGKSASIELTGWCESPAISLAPGCPAEQLELPAGGGNVEVSLVRALYGGTVAERAPSSATLTVTDPDGATVTELSANLMNGSYRFMNVNLGNEEQAVDLTIELTDTYANTTTVTCRTTLVADLPSLTITSPANATTFGPNDGCDPGQDSFGVELSVTLDQTDDRELGYRVGEGELESVPITGTNMVLCVPVSDGSNMITVQLESTLGVGAAKPRITVFADTLQITEPAADSLLMSGDDYCDDEFGAHVVVEVAPALEGSPATVSDGMTDVAATVSGGVIDTCLPLSQGTSRITVSLDDTSVSRSVDVTVITGGPTSPITLTGAVLPSGNDYRTGQVSVGWQTPELDFEGQLLSYELRCARTQIAGSAPDQDKEDWWNAATIVPLGGDPTPPATSGRVEIPIGESLHCVLRGIDAADQLTPIPNSTVVSYPLREVRVDVTDLNRMGHALASIGDVNDDNVNDVLLGGAGRAYLYLGRAGGLAGKSNPNAPDVTFIGTVGTPQYQFGTRVAALGDINGDGESDFAISHPSYGSVTGAVYVFYGRRANDAWPSTVMLTGDPATACGADVCFVGEVASEYFGYALAPAGDFNNDGRPDIAIGAAGRPLPGSPSPDSLAGRLYVLLGRAFEGSGGTRPSQFWNIGMRLPAGNPLGFYVDGAGSTGNDLTSSSQMGNAVAPVGNVDGVAGADLLINAFGRSSLSITSKLYFLSGRTHNGSAPALRAIPNSALELKSTGQTNVFAVRLAPLRNWYDDTESGVVDVAVFSSSANSFYVYLGDENGSGQRFASDTRITVNGPAGSAFGNAGLGSSRGYNPNLGNASRSDIDGDGLDDLCIGAGNGAAPIYVFYGSTAANEVASRTLGFAAASQINPAPRPGTIARTMQPVGDITGDGAIDFVIGEPDANSNAGGVTILY